MVSRLFACFLVASSIGCAAAATDAASDAGSFDDDPNHDADPNAASPPDDPTTPPATRSELIKTFSPNLHLHPDDGYRPANVDWYLARVRMRFHHDNCPDHELVDQGKLTQALLVAQHHDQNGSLCRHDDAKSVASTASESFFLEVMSDATYKGAPRNEWKTYVVWRPRPTGGLVDIEYWAFYPYNDGFGIFNHEADWEHVRVTIDPKAKAGQGAVIEVKFSEHKDGTTLQASDPSLTLEGGTHPVSYVAKGTHANYPKPGTYVIPGTREIAKDDAKATAPGDVWKTANSVVEVGTRAAPKNGQQFVKYWGRWGQIGDLPETSGITRHFP